MILRGAWWTCHTSRHDLKSFSLITDQRTRMGRRCIFANYLSHRKVSIVTTRRYRETLQSFNHGNIDRRAVVSLVSHVLISTCHLAYEAGSLEYIESDYGVVGVDAACLGMVSVIANLTLISIEALSPPNYGINSPLDDITGNTRADVGMVPREVSFERYDQPHSIQCAPFELTNRKYCGR